MTIDKDELTPENAMSVVSEAAGCGDHPCEVPFKQEDIERVFFYERNEGDYAEGDSTAVFRLKDGRYVIAFESCDTSGHG